MSQRNLFLNGANRRTLAGRYRDIPDALYDIQTVINENDEMVGVSVKEFGAVGDRVADDTAAFSTAKALDEWFFVPDGTYLVDYSTWVNAKTFGPGVIEIVFADDSTYQVSAEKTRDAVRPLYSIEDTTISVASSGEALTSVQAALNILPFFKQHNFIIELAEGNYTAEGTLIVPVHINEINNETTSREHDWVIIRGVDGATIANVRLHSLFCAGGATSWTQLQRLSFEGTLAELYPSAPSDENVSIDVRPGTNLVTYDLRFVNNSGSDYTAGISAYGGNVEVKGPTVMATGGSNYYQYFVQVKRSGSLTMTDASNPVTGVLRTGAVRNEGGFAGLDDGTVTATLAAGGNAIDTCAAAGGPVFVTDFSSNTIYPVGVDRLRSFKYMRFAASDTPTVNENLTLQFSGATGLDGASGQGLYVRLGGTQQRVPHGTRAAAIADHATPAAATNEEIATKQNAILAVMRTFGLIAT